MHPLATLPILSLVALAMVPHATEPGVDDGLALRSWDHERYVVHEWGTFVSVAGSDGESLPGLIHDPFDLPPFIYDLCDQLALTGLTPKMETPVIYFYAPEPWSVRVRVGFPRGLLTQWYPATTRANLRGGNEIPEPLATDGTDPRLADGFLDWGRFGELTVLGPEQDFDTCSPEAKETSLACFPAVSEDNPWRFARQVAANPIRVTNYTPLPDSAEEYRPHDEYEHFLFYRGLGDFELPLVAKILEEHIDGERASLRLSLENPDPALPLEHLVLIVADHGRVGFAELGALEGRQVFERLDVPLVASAGALDELASKVARQLGATGLYHDEALAMAHTWQASWFGEDGVRILYVLPSSLIDRELPLQVDAHANLVPEGAQAAGPAPEEIVRTFVGRVELLSPERERAILSAFTAACSARAPEREAARRVIASWGRYALPYLERARAMGFDEASAQTVAPLLHELAGRP